MFQGVVAVEPYLLQLPLPRKGWVKAQRAETRRPLPLQRWERKGGTMAYLQQWGRVRVDSPSLILNPLLPFTFHVFTSAVSRPHKIVSANS